MLAIGRLASVMSIIQPANFWSSFIGSSDHALAKVERLMVALQPHRPEALNPAAAVVTQYKLVGEHGG